ncbi:MAG: MFS transporter [Trueperaceae bacterium]|nr:MFS transporter [Trueperaceae bacterium]
MPAATPRPGPRPRHPAEPSGAPGGSPSVAPPGGKRALMALGLLVFLHLGLLLAAYGPSFAALQARHGVSVAEVGTSVSAHFAGGFVGVLVAGLLIARLGYRRSMVLSAALLGLGGAGVGFTGSWSLVLVGAALNGLGYGVAVVLYNFLFARAFAPAGAAAVNLVNGAYGVGAIAMPALIGWLMGLAIARDPAAIAQVPPLVFGLTTALALVVVAMAAWVPWLPPRRSGAAARGSPSPAGSRLAGGVVLFSALMFLYVAVEVATAAWAPTHLAEALGVAGSALAVSVFWGALTAGRFLAAAFAARLRPADLILGGMALTFVGIGLAHAPAVALAGYALVGLGLAPVFPTAVVWIDRHFGERADRVAPWILAAGNLGPVVGAPAVGLAVAFAGPAVVPSTLAVALLALGAVVLAIRRRASPAAGTPAR